MKIIRNPKQLQREMERLRRRGRSIGFVPTMGALHEGHLSLVRKARKENRFVVVSIFVNPLQFGPKEDVRRYPKPLSRDRKFLEKEKVDILFLPSAHGLYPQGKPTLIDVPELSGKLCGKFRTGHFQGVATVVAKLFNLVQPHRAYFGAKDYQQALIIKRLVEDLNFNLEVKVLPLIRDRDGLALSSRNAYLSPGERRRALSIPHALLWAKREVAGGNRNLPLIRSGILKRLRQVLDRIDYVEIVQPKTLESVTSLRGRALVAIAGWAGKTRLIDNAIIAP
jgi:pantoate--beta-alanine ligase